MAVRYTPGRLGASPPAGGPETRALERHSCADPAVVALRIRKEISDDPPGSARHGDCSTDWQTHSKPCPHGHDGRSTEPTHRSALRVPPKSLAARSRETVGKVIGNEQMEAEGEAKELKGQAKQEAAKAAERVKGKVEETVGAVKNRVGAVIGNEQMQAEGKVKELTGEGRQNTNR